MNLSQRFLAFIGVFGAGIVSSTSPSHAITADEMEQARLACDRALQENTIAALEEYLRLHPRAPTACKVLALEALGKYSPNDGGENQGISDTSYGG